MTAVVVFAVLFLVAACCRCRCAPPTWTVAYGEGSHGPGPPPVPRHRQSDHAPPGATKRPRTGAAEAGK